MKLQVDILARELHFQVFPKNLTSDQRHLDIYTANLHRTWIKVTHKLMLSTVLRFDVITFPKKEQARTCYQSHVQYSPDHRHVRKHASSIYWVLVTGLFSEASFGLVVYCKKINHKIFLKNVAKHAFPYSNAADAILTFII